MYFINIEPSYFFMLWLHNRFLKKMGHRVQERIAYEFMLCMQLIDSLSPSGETYWFEKISIP